MEVSEEVKITKEIIQTLLKAKKNIRMYPQNNPLHKKTVDDTFHKLREIFHYRDELALKIKQNEIFFDTEQVYANPDKEDNLALFFFKDGLRELTFRKGLDSSELEDFLKIIAMDFDREVVDDDVVTLLWERDFQNIKYIADEAVLAEDEDYESKAVQEVKGKSAEEDNVLKAYSEAFDAEYVKDIAIINLTDKDLHLLVKEMEKDQKDKIHKIYDILVEMLFQSESIPEFEDTLRLLKEVFSFCISHGGFDTLLKVLQRTRELEANPSTSDSIKPHLTALLGYISSENSVTSVGKLFDAETEISEELLDRYISYLTRNAIPPFLSLLGDLESIHARKMVIRILIALGKEDIQAIARGLSDHRWYLVRNIIYILRNIGDKKAVDYLLTTVRHKDERVRKEAIKTLGEMKSPLAIHPLRDCLNDPDDTIRRAAVKSLGSIGTETAKRIIIEALSHKDFIDREFDEKKEFFEVLTTWKDQDITDLLLKYLKKTSFFRKTKTDEMRACAAYCLGLMNCRDALPFLSKLTGSSNKLLRDHAVAAVRKLEHA